jgi:hypothetical protein
MKISVDDKELFTLSDIQEQVIKNDINAEMFDTDMKRRLQWILMHKYEECFKDLKKEWDDKLAANGIDMIPTDPDKYAQLVFSQPNYKDRAAREKLLDNQQLVGNEQLEG